MPDLIVQSGKHQGKKLVLPETDVVIGRDENCQIRLGSQDISRRHCLLRHTPQGWHVKDLDSQNGTFVNDVAVTRETLLKPGDLLRVGPLTLQVPGAKPPVKKTPADGMAVAKVAKPPKLEDQIADWLTEEDTHTASASTHDTTIISGRSIAAAAAAAAPGNGHAPANAPEAKKSYATLAEEAAAIIRRYHDLKKQPVAKSE